MELVDEMRDEIRSRILGEVPLPVRQLALARLPGKSSLSTSIPIAFGPRHRHATGCVLRSRLLLRRERAWTILFRVERILFLGPAASCFATGPFFFVTGLLV